MSEFKKTLTLFVVACVILQVSGLRCWKCENAKSPEDCLLNGYSKQCRYLEKTCQTEVRLSEGLNLLIKTDCKEPHACNNNEIQNPRQAWYPVQCNGDIWNSVCRCCCGSYHCNKENLLCESSKQSPPEKIIDSDPKKDHKKKNIKSLKPEGPTCGKTPATPKNGKKSCHELGKTGINCIFSCNQGYSLIGPENSSCRGDNTKRFWSHKTPKCIKKEVCSDLGHLQHGEITCDGESYSVGTICHFRCIEDGYKLMPSDRTQTECIADGTGAKWSKRKPCCSTQCPPKAQKDVVIIMDSSSSITGSEWTRMKNFVADVTKNFDISRDGVQFAVYRFFRKVDTDHQVHFGNFTNDNQGLQQAILDLPKRGGGTYIGRALKHAKDNVLTNRNREHVKDLIWLLTDGRSDDDAHEIAQELRDMSVEILALGISRRGKEFFKDELLNITGQEDNVLDVKNGMKSLTKDLVDRIVGKFCESSCRE